MTGIESTANTRSVNAAMSSARKSGGAIPRCSHKECISVILIRHRYKPAEHPNLRVLLRVQRFILVLRHANTPEDQKPAKDLGDPPELRNPLCVN